MLLGALQGPLFSRAFSMSSFKRPIDYIKQLFTRLEPLETAKPRYTLIANSTQPTVSLAKKKISRSQEDSTPLRSILRSFYTPQERYSNFSNKRHLLRAKTFGGVAASRERQLGNGILSNFATSLLVPRDKCQWRSARQRSNFQCADWCRQHLDTLNLKHLVKHPTMWHNPECCRPVDCEPVFRHDVVYMPGSDKRLRKYQRTWTECPPLKICPKRRCCPEMIPPPYCRRPKNLRPTTAGPFSKDATCVPRELRCVKKRLPCCALPREPPTCKVFPTPKCCQKRCTPYPSFSECCRPPFSSKMAIECFCLLKPTLCEMIAHYKRMGVKY